MGRGAGVGGQTLAGERMELPQLCSLTPQALVRPETMRQKARTFCRTAAAEGGLSPRRPFLLTPTEQK